MIIMNDKKKIFVYLMVKFKKKNMFYFIEKKIISILLNYLEILLLVGILFK